ncbi:MAG: 16S rRNA (uracil(1498)-N(3))-methyltransferase [Gammaproteobacteria bacterium]|nr:MAG: 16S rRNA (uracil(1498)-N(3))-methyltransferase [Gammaproteobacteria bacterium]
MRLIRVYVAGPLAPAARVQVTGAAAAHVTRVLRLGAGDAVTLFNGDGHDYPARIADLQPGVVTAAIEGVAAARPESPLTVTLVQGIARAERMDLVVQKATELGVSAIQPVVTARGVVRLNAESAAKKLTHWQGIAIAACEQSGRARLPTLEAPLSLHDWLQRPARANVLRVQLAPGATVALARAAAGASAIELLVGPEGGLDPTEQEAAERAGYHACHLGPRVLRSETAALAALAVLQATAGDFR